MPVCLQAGRRASGQADEALSKSAGVLLITCSSCCPRALPALRVPAAAVAAAKVCLLRVTAALSRLSRPRAMPCTAADTAWPAPCCSQSMVCIGTRAASRRARSAAACAFRASWSGSWVLLPARCLMAVVTVVMVAWMSAVMEPDCLRMEMASRLGGTGAAMCQCLCWCAAGQVAQHCLAQNIPTGTANWCQQGPCMPCP
jgi:hypothetical protein